MESPISSATSPSPTASQELAAEVSNRVFKKVLWAAAFIAFLIYFPWGIALLLAAWAVIGLVKRHPGGAAKFLQWSLTAGIAFGVYFWLRPRTENERQEKTERQLAHVDIQAMLDREMGAFMASCVQTASKRSPQLADAYCSCLADALRAQFDATPITAYSVEDYRQQFSSRFGAASPNQFVQSVCLDKARPKPALLPVVRATKPRKAPIVSASTAGPDPNDTGVPTQAPYQVWAP